MQQEVYHDGGRNYHSLRHKRESQENCLLQPCL